MNPIHIADTHLRLAAASRIDPPTINSQGLLCNFTSITYPQIFL